MCLQYIVLHFFIFKRHFSKERDSLVAQLVKNPPAMWETWVWWLGILYSGLENSMDCIVHGITKSQTLLNNFHFTSLHFTKKTAHKGVPKSIPLSLESSKRTLTSQRLWEVLPWGNWFGFNMGVSYFQTPMCLKLWHCILGELPGTMKLRWEKLFSNYVEIFKAQYITMITIIRYFPVYKAISYVSSHFIPINILGTRKGN